MKKKYVLTKHGMSLKRSAEEIHTEEAHTEEVAKRQLLEGELAQEPQDFRNIEKMLKENQNFVEKTLTLFENTYSELEDKKMWEREKEERKKCIPQRTAFGSIPPIPQESSQGSSSSPCGTMNDACQFDNNLHGCKFSAEKFRQLVLSEKNQCMFQKDEGEAYSQEIQDKCAKECEERTQKETKQYVMDEYPRNQMWNQKRRMYCRLREPLDSQLDFVTMLTKALFAFHIKQAWFLGYLEVGKNICEEIKRQSQEQHETLVEKIKKWGRKKFTKISEMSIPVALSYAMFLLTEKLGGDICEYVLSKHFTGIRLIKIIEENEYIQNLRPILGYHNSKNFEPFNKVAHALYELTDQYLFSPVSKVFSDPTRTQEALRSAFHGSSEEFYYRDFFAKTLETLIEKAMMILEQDFKNIKNDLQEEDKKENAYDRFTIYIKMVVAVISSILFGLCHYTNVYVPGRTPDGVICQIIMCVLGGFIFYCLKQYNGLLASWSLHFTWNFTITMNWAPDIRKYLWDNPFIGGGKASRRHIGRQYTTRTRRHRTTRGSRKWRGGVMKKRNKSKTKRATKSPKTSFKKK